MATLAGFLGDVLVTSPPSVNLSPLPTVLTDSGDHKTFNNPTAAQRLWDKAATTTVQTTTDGSTWTSVGAGTYVIRYLDGQVVLNSALTGTPGCRISAGKYFPYASIGFTTEWSAALAVKPIDVTSHVGVGGSPWDVYIMGTLSGTVTLKKWWIDETFINAVVNRTQLVLACVAPDGHHYDMYGYFTDESVKLAVAGAVEEDLTFKASDVVVYV